MVMKSAHEIAQQFAQFGQEAVDHMESALSRTPEEGWPGLIRFARATGLMVPEMNGKPAEEELFNCWHCKDKGFTISLEKSKLYQREIERVFPCQRCDDGLLLEASEWRQTVEPQDAKGNRYRDELGWKKFNRHYSDKPARRQIVLDRMNELMTKRKRQPGRGE